MALYPNSFVHTSHSLTLNPPSVQLLQAFLLLLILYFLCVLSHSLFPPTTTTPTISLVKGLLPRSHTCLPLFFPSHSSLPCLFFCVSDLACILRGLDECCLTLIVWNFLPHSFPGLMARKAGLNHLWLVYLGQISRNITKQLLKLLLFWEDSLSSLT